MTRAEEHAEKVRRGFVAPDWDLDAKAALSELVADAEALAEALEEVTAALRRQVKVTWMDETEVGRLVLRTEELLARYRGEK